MLIKRIALLSVHTSPLAPLGGKKTGGMNVYVREFARELGKRGVEIDIFTRRADTLTPEVDTSLGVNVRVISVPCGAEQFLSPDEVYEHLSEFTAGVIAYTTKTQRQYNLIYSHYWLSGWVANKLDEVWNIPIVHMFHTLGQMKNRIGSTPVPMMIPDVRISTETKIMQWADRLIAATPAEVAQLLWLYRADRRKIDIVPPGVDSEHFQPIPKKDAKRYLNIPASKNLFVFVGRIEPLKGVDSIIKAVDIICSEMPAYADNLSVAVIGGNPRNPDEAELTRLQELTHSLDLQHVIKFLGAKDHKWLPYYYGAADAVIVPSDYESFGMVALEAMASGTPVIASDVGGLAYLVRDKETGFRVPARNPESLAEAIISIMTDCQRQAMLGENATKFAQHYSWTSIVDQLLPIFESLINGRSSKVSV